MQVQEKVHDIKAKKKISWFKKYRLMLDVRLKKQNKNLTPLVTR